jgi:signal transduction histidine kinase
MFSRPRRGALGLRGRIVGLVLFTTVATLAVAALTLLGPLESKLRSSALATLKHELGNSPERSLRSIDLAPVVPTAAAYGAARLRLEQIAHRTDATTVAVLGYPDTTGQGPVQPYSVGVEPGDPFADAPGAFNSGGTRSGFITIDGSQYARVAIPFSTRRSAITYRWVLAVRKGIAEVPRAFSAVRTAFLTAALAGLGLTLLLAIPLAATLVRRLRRLRVAALLLAQGGPEVEVPGDRARDEVGDLARTFVTMQHQLRQQEDARRAFVATASHELRTPLASLDGMLELLDDDLRAGDSDIDEVRALLARARVQSRRLARLAADLLDLSRLDAEVKLRSEPVELSELSRAVLAEFELVTAERDISSTLELADDQVWALADPGSVARIVRILLDNAVRVSPAGSRVTVELHNGSTAELSVADQGSGIRPEDRQVIFERFQRGRDTGGKAGFGLGLAIGRELAERMGGELVLDDSYSPGARFMLRLPVAPKPEVGALALR